MFGFLNIYKPVGMTSHDVISRLRKVSKIKQIGHTGTLDPFAQGVLPVAIGKAARLIEFLEDDKEYLAVIKFGAATTTYDAEGELTFTSEKQVTRAEVEDALKDFSGEILQTPPVYSAIKVKGRKLYDYARKGEAVEVEPRRVVIENIELKNMYSGQCAEILVKCSKGTYIRSIAHDLGEKLGVGGHLVKLVRTKAGRFGIQNAIALDELDTQEKIPANLINPADVLPQRKYEVTAEEAEKIKHGQFLLNKGYNNGEIVILVYNKIAMAAAAALEDKLLIKKVLLTLIIFMLNLPAFAQYDCVKPYDLANPAGRFFTSASGINFCVQQYAQSAAKKIIKKSVNTSKLKVKIKSFSPMDLKAGRFKSLEFKGEDLNMQGVYLSSLEVKTLCNFNYIVPDEKNNTAVFKENLVLGFSAMISEDDLNNIIKSDEYVRLIGDFNRAAEKTGILRIIDTRIKIKNDRFLFIIKTAVPFIKRPQEITISSDLTVKNGNIRFKDTKLINSSFTMDLSKLSYVLNYLNPLEYSLKILENKDVIIQITDVSVKDNKIMADGTAVIPKDSH
ncbi:MAG: tRNA pseudouridine(55) synthase TruB [Heliobacteriaceae bacterium]|jgi:tRNA pseudouridine55 synthase|nr:tRNA pseudouridine(55) synthase TruB [Heliobacteriaceae bacterium]